MDLIRTIEETDDIDYESDESSTSDHDAQPHQKQRKTTKKNKSSATASSAANINKSGVFESNFAFDISTQDFGVDAWNDVSKYFKKKKLASHRTTLDEKIRKIRSETRQADMKDIDNEGSMSDEGVEISDDELVHDAIKMKEREVRMKERRIAKSGGSGQPGVTIEDEEEKEEMPSDGDDCAGGDGDGFDHLTPSISSSFHTMNISRPLLKSIESMGFLTPTPIQGATIPLALSGRDVCGCAATGTGKTAAYMLPVLERLLFRPKDSSSITRVLVLVPTRELGVQVYQVSKRLAQFTSVQFGLSVGGLDLKMQEASLRKSPDVVIATPGRLIDHLQNTPTFDLLNIEVLILDEADKMLDDCFVDQMKSIIKSCSPTRQTLLFSATMCDEIEDLATVSLKRPVKIFVDSNKVVAWNLKQEFVRIREGKESTRDAVLASLLFRTFRDHCIIFVRTKKQCHRLHILLGLMGLKLAELHGNMSQTFRLQSLESFKNGEVDFLLTTDVAARGLDIPGVKTVINYELPDTVKQYIHRVGRTARAGRVGRSVSLGDESHRKVIREIVKNARNPVKNRVIPQTIIDKYIDKVGKLSKEVNRVEREEEAERQISNLENQTNKLEKQLVKDKAQSSTEIRGEDRRIWFQDRDQLKLKAKQERKAASKKRKLEKMKSKLDLDDQDQREAYREGQFIAREAKRSRKYNKIRTVDEAVKPVKGKGGGGGGSRSVFNDSDLTDVKRRNVKRLRHESKRPSKPNNNKKKTNNRK